MTHTKLTKEFIEGEFLQPRLIQIIKQYDLIGFPFDMVNMVKTLPNTDCHELFTKIRIYINNENYGINVTTTKTTEGWVKITTFPNGSTVTQTYNNDRLIQCKVLRSREDKDVPIITKKYHYNKDSQLVNVTENNVIKKNIHYTDNGVLSKVFTQDEYKEYIFDDDGNVCDIHHGSGKRTHFITTRNAIHIIIVARVTFFQMGTVVCDDYTYIPFDWKGLENK